MSKINGQDREPTKYPLKNKGRSVVYFFLGHKEKFYTMEAALSSDVAIHDPEGRILITRMPFVKE